MSRWINTAVLLVLLSPTKCDDSDYRRHRIYRLQVPTNVMNLFSNALLTGEVSGKYDILHPIHGHRRLTDVMVRPSALKEFKKLISDYGISSKVIDFDVERSIRRSRRANLRARTRQRSRRSITNLMTHGAYLSFQEMETTLISVVKMFKMTDLEEIGRTAENRSIWLLKISVDKSLPVVWIDAGIHAREWIAPATALYIIDKLLSSEAHPMLAKYQFYILPIINPDGYVYSYTRNRYWRKNRKKFNESRCFGVDLNRNFPFKWGHGGSSSNACTEIFRGHSPGDQEETKCIIKKLASIANQTKLFITLHAYGQLILMPYGYQRNVHPPQYDQLHTLARAIIYAIWKESGYIYSTGTAADILYPASGGADDFACGNLSIPYTYTIELPDIGSHNFLLPPSFIVPVGEQMWQALRVSVKYMK